MKSKIIAFFAVMLLLNAVFAYDKATYQEQIAYSCNMKCVDLAKDGNINFFDTWLVYQNPPFFGSYSSLDLNSEQKKVCCWKQQNWS